MKQIYYFLKTASSILIVLLTTIPIFISCSKNGFVNNGHNIKPTGPVPAWGPDITPQMLEVILTLDTIAPAPIHTLTPAQARLEPSAADAAMRVMKNYNIPAPVMNVDTVGRDIAVAGGTIHIRIYTPKTGKKSYPVIVYYHGGGWVIATINTYNSSAQALAEKTDAILISVEYRKGPEFKFPTAHNDCFTAYKWALANASTFNGDSTRVALAGESAGGNLAVAVSMMARDSAVRLPIYEVSVYPVASNDPNTPSKLKYVDSRPLQTPDLPWFLMYYLADTSQSSNPLISLVNANLAGLPATTIIGAELDPLQSEGKTLAEKLQAAGVKTNYKLYYGVTHEFFGMGAVVPEAADAENLAAQVLRSAFHN